MQKGLNIVLGVCGGISVYKAVNLARELIKEGANVDVIMTLNSTQFVSPLTFQTLTKNPVIVGMFDKTNDLDIKHISLAKKANLIIVAPATANILGKVANGIADDMLTTTIMASKAKVFFVPAMNSNMYENKIVVENIKKLKKTGYIIIKPDIGELACSENGIGRFPDITKIIKSINNTLKKDQRLKGKKVLVTAGPTREYIDPVRYISNPSTGKMGYAIAKEFIKEGADVLVISGPVNLPNLNGAKVIKVQNASQMYKEVKKCYNDIDICVFTAAVADYRPSVNSENKIKKSDKNLSIKLIPNVDISKSFADKKENRLHIGFCAETQYIYKNAIKKLKEKNFDIIVANDITKEGAGFGTDTNIVDIINKNGETIKLKKMLKEDIAKKIIEEILKIMK